MTFLISLTAFGVSGWWLYHAGWRNGRDQGIEETCALFYPDLHDDKSAS